MKLPPETAARVAAAIKDLRSEPVDHVDAIAKRHGAIPLLADMGGALLLRPDGAMLELLWDAEDSPTPAPLDQEPLGWVAGAERYEWLAALIPPRPTGAVDCTACSGKGKIAVQGATRGRVFCGACRALGWRDVA
jgi:hypothetical protein